MRGTSKLYLSLVATCIIVVSGIIVFFINQVSKQIKSMKKLLRLTRTMLNGR